MPTSILITQRSKPAAVTLDLLAMVLVGSIAGLALGMVSVRYIETLS